MTWRFQDGDVWQGPRSGDLICWCQLRKQVDSREEPVANSTSVLPVLEAFPGQRSLLPRLQSMVLWAKESRSQYLLYQHDIWGTLPYTSCKSASCTNTHTVFRRSHGCWQNLCCALIFFHQQMLYLTRLCIRVVHALTVSRSSGVFGQVGLPSFATLLWFIVHRIPHALLSEMAPR